MNQLTNLLKIAHVDAQFNYHELFKETAKQVIDRDPSEYGKHTERMAELGIIIRLQANPFEIPAEFVVYHYDLTLAIKEITKQIKAWKQ